MNTREYYAQCFRAERPKFIRVLSSIPHDRADFKPHPKNNSAADIAWRQIAAVSEVVAIRNLPRADWIRNWFRGGPIGAQSLLEELVVIVQDVGDRIANLECYCQNNILVRRQDPYGVGVLR